jgi:hypothetical protein
MSSRGQRAQGPWTVASFVALATLTLIIFWSVGAQFLDWFSLDLGSITTMSAGYTYFLLFWCLFGAIAAVFFTLAFAHLAGADWAQETYAQLRATSDRHLMLAFSAIAFALPALLYWRLFQGVHLTDDESVYRFSAELLASGRLYADSPPMKLFFDHVFMINDGKFYSQYFMGWPALLAPWVALRVPELANPMYSALTVPAIFLTLRELAGRRCAVIGVLLFLSAPMIHFTAATQLSHTSCLFALAWMTYLTLRANRGDSSWWLHPGIAVTFSVAFFIRPTVALGMGVPLLFVWAVSIRRISPQQRLGAVLGFAAPALLFGGAFFAVNALQNGSIGYVAYQRAADYARENGFHFSAWSSLSDDWTPSFGWMAVRVSVLAVRAVAKPKRLGLVGDGPWLHAGSLQLAQCRHRHVWARALRGDRAPDPDAERARCRALDELSAKRGAVRLCRSHSSGTLLRAHRGDGVWLRASEGSRTIRIVRVRPAEVHVGAALRFRAPSQ